MTVDLAKRKIKNRELEESGLAHVQTPDMRGHDLIIVIDQRESVDHLSGKQRVGVTHGRL
jgi:hypothetical protein